MELVAETARLAEEAGVVAEAARHRVDFEAVRHRPALEEADHEVVAHRRPVVVEEVAQLRLRVLTNQANALAAWPRSPKPQRNGRKKPITCEARGGWVGSDQINASKEKTN